MDCFSFYAFGIFIFNISSRKINLNLLKEGKEKKKSLLLNLSFVLFHFHDKYQLKLQMGYHLQ